MSRIVRKPIFVQISFAVTGKLISVFVFATRIVQFLFFLKPKFQSSRFFLKLYRAVCVRPGRKPRRPVFSRRGSYSTTVKEQKDQDIHIVSHSDNVAMNNCIDVIKLTQMTFYSMQSQFL